MALVLGRKFGRFFRRSRAVTALAGALLGGMPMVVDAKNNCDAQGGLFYLGNTKNDARSVWLSATSPGSFRLDAAQGNTTVDRWSRSHRGLNITASPFVSTGNGGVHKLYDTSGNKDCLLDSQNQKGGVTLPPHITLPDFRPPNIAVPPIGDLFPGFRPPGGMPSRPVRPPQGITPALPGGVTPPVGTLPPQGVTPPIGTLPPQGVTPPVGTLPPQGVTPPIGTLPPQGITPGLPVQPTPPVGTLPPGPGTPTPPPPATVTVTPVPGPLAIDAPSPGTVLPPDDRQLLDCPDPRRRDPDLPVRPECENVKPMCWPDNCQASIDGLQQVPITPGRDLGVGLLPDWNLWTDFTAVSVSDGRYGLDVTGWSRLGTVGLDRRISGNLVIGLSFSLEDSMTGGYGGFFSAATRGLTFSPYAALLLSDNWAIEAALGYSRLSNNISIAVLSGSYFSQRLSGSLRLHGQYDLDFFAVRPRLSSNYVKTFSDGYDMQGSILGQALAVTYAGADYDYATFEAAVELNKLFTMANGDRLMPFAEVGALYEAVRPNGGQILSSNLQLVTPSPWSLQARAGVRMLVSDAILLEARVGYLSFGQSGLDVVEGRLHLSFSF